VVLADGTIAKSGGKVVKNVAGYDLGKLFTGSYGTLGVIASCTFKLQPLAPARRVVSVPAPAPGAVVRAIAASPTAIVAAEYGGSVVVVDAPEEIKRSVDVWGPVDGVRVMHRVKERFDPDARLNRGRFVDGI